MSKEIQELQKRWQAVLETVHSNSHVVAFMNSRVGRYLDDHPFLTLSLVVFLAASAIPVAFFLFFVVATTVIACVGVIIMEGLVISMGGVTLLCVLGGLGMLSLAVSAVVSVCYLSLTTLLNYWLTPNVLSKKEIANGSSFIPSSPPALDQDATNKKSE
ncbi:lipid droplet assembly factor 1 [Varanus komodoensis]|uniref:Transmembrane protein 159 n=1 Tax=Varanus komodoensis TaxID=61221 RepID=A0A8D2IZV1_VARKO|nr:lipid droplet assembly factor 1 [Varanus komodoensis]